MRRIPLSAVALFGTVACAAACSSGPGVSPQSQPTAEPPASSASSSTSAPAAARSLSLVGDGHTLTLKGAPADPSYVATYPISGLTGMTVAASVFGDLSAACASGGGAVACTALPFFTSVGVGSGAVKVFDAYGHVVLTAPAPSGADAGGAPLPSAFDAGTWDAGGTWGAGGGVGVSVGIEAGSCAPSVTASLAGCSLTVAGVTCDCCDATCAAGAIQACLGSLGVPVGAGGGALGGGLGGILDDAGLPGLPGSGGFGGFADAGPSSAACDSSAIASAQAQFCSDVDAWVVAHGGTATLDCAALGTLSFPTTLPAPSTSGFTCNDATHDAFVKVRADLATCDPLSYVGWDSSAELQLFEASACTVW